MAVWCIWRTSWSVMTLLEELLHLLQHERVALDRSAVVGLLVPDVRPDVLRLSGRR